MDIIRIAGLAGQLNSGLTAKASAFEGLEVNGRQTKYQGPVAAYSNYKQPITQTGSALRGEGRNWGQASDETQRGVMELICESSSHLPEEDRAILLGIARLESGFNPDAAATSTSASGVFQIVKKTAIALGLSPTAVFDARANIAAGVKLYEENSTMINRTHPKISGNERAVLLYALHHDGPALESGGTDIARTSLLPYLDEMRKAVAAYR